MAKIWLVEGEHMEIPGLVRSAHASHSSAILEAISTVELIGKDSPLKLPKVTALNWRNLVDRLQEYHGAANVNVVIIELELKA